MIIAQNTGKQDSPYEVLEGVPTGGGTMLSSAVCFSLRFSLHRAGDWKSPLPSAYEPFAFGKE